MVSQKHNEYDMQESNALQSNNKKINKQENKEQICMRNTSAFTFSSCCVNKCCDVLSVHEELKPPTHAPLSSIETKTFFWGAITELAQLENFSLFEWRQCHGGGKMTNVEKKSNKKKGRSSVSIYGDYRLKKTNFQMCTFPMKQVRSVQKKV